MCSNAVFRPLYAVIGGLLTAYMIKPWISQITTGTDALLVVPRILFALYVDNWYTKVLIGYEAAYAGN